jgi:N-carbamoylputrescine amidase
MKLTLLQLGARASVDENVQLAVTTIFHAAETHNADLLVLPEFFNTIYFPQYSDVAQYWSLAEGRDDSSLTAVRDAARTTQTAVVASMYERWRTGIHFDTAFFIDREGAIQGDYNKVHAPGIDGGYEKLYYRPGDLFSVVAFDGWQIGLLLCYDWRFPEACRALAALGADLIILPFATPQMTMWEEGLRTRAWENQVYLAACNRVGRDGAWQFSGDSLIIDPYGTVLARGSSTDDDIVVADLELARISEARLTDFNWRDRRPDVYGALVQSYSGGR